MNVAAPWKASSDEAKSSTPLASGRAAAALGTDPSAVVPEVQVSETLDTSVPSSQGPSAIQAEVSSAPAAKPAYSAPASLPTQIGPAGILFDFNDGCRVVLPESQEPWQVRLSDIDTGNVLFETKIGAGHVNSAKRYFVHFRIEISQNGTPVLVHDYSALDKDVLIQFPVGTLGDTIGWLPYAIKFQERHGCRLTCGLAERLIPLFKDAYPNVNFIPTEDVKPERYYATYKMGLFFDDKDFAFQPCDFRKVGLHRTAGYILGVDPAEVAPLVALADNSRPIAEPYVVIATQSTTQAKYWNNPNGWHEIVAFLKDAGYRVICIDQKKVHGHGLVWNHIPNGAEDETGDRPLQERARWIAHAEFFVGLASGLSWLAWCTNTPVVMISGFSHPLTEFTTPYRVINYHTCNSCWDDPLHRFDHKDFLWCPRHKDTPRQFECTRLITAEQVKQTIQRIPGFGVQADSRPKVTRKSRLK
jgi:autotransporter strand-loop-strand O-heptosyltransferase